MLLPRLYIRYLKRIFFITLPYLVINSLQLRTKLVKTFAKSMSWCKLNIVFKTSNRLGSFFQFKDKLPQTLVSGVIYKYKCSRCNASYIGKTFRYYETRLQEHLDISALTGKPRKCLQLWPPKEHLKECRGINTRENFTIIGREKDRHLLRLKESISIYLQKPNLNDIRESTKLYLFNWCFYFFSAIIFDVLTVVNDFVYFCLDKQQSLDNDQSMIEYMRK